MQFSVHPLRCGDLFHNFGCKMGMFPNDHPLYCDPLVLWWQVSGGWITGERILAQLVYWYWIYFGLVRWYVACSQRHTITMYNVCTCITVQFHASVPCPIWLTLQFSKCSMDVAMWVTTYTISVDWQTGRHFIFFYFWNIRQLYIYPTISKLNHTYLVYVSVCQISPSSLVCNLGTWL